MAEVLWYYAKDNEQQGPVSAAQLRKLASTGDLQAADLVWRDGMGEWAPAGNIKGLFAATAIHVVTDAEPPPPPIAETPAGPIVAANFAPTAAVPPVSLETPPPRESVRQERAVRRQAGFGSADVLKYAQGSLWFACTVVVLIGGVQFALAAWRANSSEEQIAAGAIYSGLFIGAYVVARSGEKLAQLLRQHRADKRHDD